MCDAKAGEIYTVPISHGEGRFIASPQQVLEFNKTGQIATQYVDFDGIASMDSRFNPNQSVAAIEGIYSLMAAYLVKWHTPNAVVQASAKIFLAN